MNFRRFKMQLRGLITALGMRLSGAIVPVIVAMDSGGVNMPCHDSGGAFGGLFLVDGKGFEPSTSALRTRRSPS